MAVYIENSDGTVEVLVEDYSAGEYAKLQGVGVSVSPTLTTDVLALKSEVTAVKSVVDVMLADLNDVISLPSVSQVGV